MILGWVRYCSCAQDTYSLGVPFKTWGIRENNKGVLGGENSGPHWTRFCPISNNQGVQSTNPLLKTESSRAFEAAWHTPPLPSPSSLRIKLKATSYKAKSRKCNLMKYKPRAHTEMNKEEKWSISSNPRHRVFKWQVQIRVVAWIPQGFSSSWVAPHACGFQLVLVLLYFAPTFPSQQSSLGTSNLRDIKTTASRTP